MKRLLIIFSLLFVHLQSSAQVIYEEGYIIDNSGTRAEVLILNKGWRFNPTDFTYKTSPDAQPTTAGINELQEVGVGDDLIFRKHRARIDRSSGQVKSMGTTRDPIFSDEEVFLKLLIAGEADLYEFKEGDVQRYFYSLKDVAVKPLVYKTYLENGKVAANNTFRQQLYENIRCGDIKAQDLRVVDYEREELVEYFETYNACLGADYNVYRGNESGGIFNFYLKAGADLATMKIAKGMHAGGNEINLGFLPRFGGEFEYVLPFNRNKWGLFAEGMYQSYNVEEEHYGNPPYDETGILLTVNMQYVSTTVGVRHYMFVGEDARFFVNAGFAFDIPMATRVYLDRGESYSLSPELNDVTTGAYALAGVGFNYGNRVSAELRYNLPRTSRARHSVPTHYDVEWESTVSSFSLILGYRLF